MKISIVGAAGLRTPLIVEALLRRGERIGLHELALMDVDANRLSLVGALSAIPERSPFRIRRTTDPEEALRGADYVITTFRVGGSASRVVDERVPLQQGLLGQETTGPGGFAMAMRTIPVLLEYVKLMGKVCPDAWLINFANPAGLLAEAALRLGEWPRTVGICDAPQATGRTVSALTGLSPNDLYLDYFGLNHLGWLRAAYHRGQDILPAAIAKLKPGANVPGLPFAPELITELGMIPNEYLFYYYNSRAAVQNILGAEQTRGERISAWNERLFEVLGQHFRAGNQRAMSQAYHSYLDHRGDTYMAGETGQATHGAEIADGEGYAGVALDLIEALAGVRSGPMILNVPNQGAIWGMESSDVVELQGFVSRGNIRPMAVGRVPSGPLGLMQEVKAYERLTIEAVGERSRLKAVHALTVHPLVRDAAVASALLNSFSQEHGERFPRLA